MMCWLSELAKIYADSGRPSIPPERLLRALLLQAVLQRGGPVQAARLVLRQEGALRALSLLEGYAHKPLHSLNLRVMKPC
jgi:hypothetical protein